MSETNVNEKRAGAGTPTRRAHTHPLGEALMSAATTIEDAPAARRLPAPTNSSTPEVTRDEYGTTASCPTCRDAIYRTAGSLAEQWAAGHQCRPDDRTVTTTARPAWATVSAPHDEVVAIDHSRPASRPIVAGDDVLLPVLFCTDVLANNLDGTMSVMRSEPCIEIKDSTAGRGVLTLDAARALRDSLSELLAAVTA